MNTRPGTPRNPSSAAVLLIAAALVAVSCAGASAAPPADPGFASAVQAAIGRVKPALIRIRVVDSSHRGGRETKSESFGSGVIISPDGYAVTNHHVAGTAVRLVVTLSTKEEVEASLTGTDALSDISVIKLQPRPGKAYAAAAFGDSSKVKVGDHVLAMGSPVALSQSVTTGIISNTEMIMPESMWPSTGLTLDGEDVGSMVRWIGHDARIAGGNSGGPLVNMRGEIIGINELQMGLSGAIPSSIAKSVAAQIIKNGRVSRAWLGLEVQPLLKSSSVKEGALIASVVDGSPSAKAGVRPGDIIQKLGGKPVSVRYGEDVPLFNQTVAALPLARPVPIVLLRGGKSLTLSASPVEREEALPRERELKAWGMTGRDISGMLARQMRRASRDGVAVTGLVTGGPASDARPPIEENDVIVAVAGDKVTTLASLVTVTDRLMAGKTGRVPVLVEFERKQERCVTVVRLGREPLRDPGVEAAKAWAPVAVQVLTQEVAEQMGLAGRNGVRVTEVYPGHSAAAAGLRVGDIIEKIDGEQIEASQPQDYEVFPAMVRRRTIGGKAQLSIIRDGKPMEISMELEPSPKLPREMKRYRSEDFEFTVRDLTFTDSGRTPADEKVSGVFVESVDEGGWAAVAKLAVGDIVMGIDGKAVSSVAEAEAKLNEIRAAKPRRVVLHVKRGAGEMFVEVEPGWSTQ